MKKTYLFATYTNYNKPLTGAHRRYIELISDLSKDANIELISGEIPQLTERDNIRYHKICTGRLFGFLPYHISSILIITKKLIEIKRNIYYDKAISFGIPITLCYFFAGINPIITLVREDYIGYGKVDQRNWFMILYMRIQELIAAKVSSKIIVQCEHDRNSIICRCQKIVPDIAKKIYTQINNINASWMPSGILKNVKLYDGCVNILFIGNFSTKRKGHGILFPVIQKLIDENYKIHLYVAGDGRDFKKYRSKYKDENIVFLGYTENLDEYFNICNILLVPSLIDSCPNSLLEGISAELAVYGANTGGIPDILEDESYMFNPDQKSLYIFLKNIMDTKKYIVDQMNQKEIKNRLTFNWAISINRIIENL